jgi:hypothetical protein
LKDYSKIGIINRVIDEIIAFLPLDEKVYIANLEKEGFDTMYRAFELYIKSVIGAKFEDKEYTDLMIALWERLRETHRLRVIK